MILGVFRGSGFWWFWEVFGYFRVFWGVVDCGTGCGVGSVGSGGLSLIFQLYYWVSGGGFGFELIWGV